MSDEPLRRTLTACCSTAAPHRGKLKVFFGACAGGENRAMLAEAQRLRARGWIF